MVGLLPSFEASKEKAKGTLRTLIKILPIIAFISPFLILYSQNPANFELAWKGRMFYIFFIWLASLEVIMSWEKLVTKVEKPASARNIVFIIVLILPTAYVMVSDFGLNNLILSWAQLSHVGWPGDMAVSIEYLVFASLFVLLMWLEFGSVGLKESAVSSLFLASIGIIFTIDTLYPYGSFTPFQALVPTTSSLAANFFNLMGYRATVSNVISNGTWVSFLQVQNPSLPINGYTNPVGFNIAWPCAGIESLIIYTCTILVFLRGSALPWKRSAIYFSVGAIVTYFINILRIATFVVLGMQFGDNSTQINDFHSLYGSLYSITWIVSYLFILMGSQMLSKKVNVERSEKTIAQNSLSSAAT
jgi:thaumarchaeosortase